MKKLHNTISTLLILLIFSSTTFAQNLLSKSNATLTKFENTPTLAIPAPDLEVIRKEDEQRDRNGELYRIGVFGYTQVTTTNTGVWVTQPDGSRIWQIHVSFQGAEALSFLFQTFKIYGETTVDVFNKKGVRVHKTLTSADVLDHFQQNIALCFGDELTLQINEPKGVNASEINIDRIVYNYRSTGNPDATKINESEACEVNVNCSPVGDAWQDEKRGVARIYVVDAQGAGFCTGTLVNNTSQDCKPLFLTALHCGINTSASNSNLWQFYFRYEAVACTNPSSAGTLDDNFITGCVRLASSNDNGGDSGSDFLLVQLGSLANQTNTINTLKSAAFNAYWNGWDANNTTSTNAAGIHHPAGDIKKISTYTAATLSTTWGGSVANTHWRVTWTQNANGYGVTEGGSSGSALYNSLGRIVGTLTGGGSFCTAQTSPDSYGKMSFHWTSNGTPANEQLKTYLDPTNTGLLVLNGSANPCAVVGGPPVANFIGNPTTLSPGGTVQFTDQSTNSPSSWTWSITPGTGWSFAGGTTANSQNPQVTFTTVGTYSVTLTATNSQGSDSETKTNYITVTLATGPCTATSTTCDEFIQNVNFGAINNTTVCTNYSSYTLSTTLNAGQQYQLTLTPQVGTTVGSAYPNDEIAAWIDYNGDLDFADAGEQVAYVLVQTGWSNVFQITVPSTVQSRTVNMRVRISYNGTDGGGAPIVPCGTSTYGEVEDYTIVLIGNTAGIDATENAQTISIYPNPATEKVSIDLSQLSAVDHLITLNDSNGKMLLQQHSIGGSVVSIPVNGFSKGIYHVIISSNEQQIIQKISIQ